MTLWDLRQNIEQSIPLWLYITTVALIVGTAMLIARRK